MLLKKYNYNAVHGFTLIELLVVISIIGVLAATLLVILNPLEQLSKSEDSGRRTAVQQLGKAVDAYFLSHASTYPTANASWQTTLIPEIKQIVSVPAVASTVCTINQSGNLCYTATTSDAAVWTPVESSAEIRNASCTAGQISVVAWVASQGKTGLTCIATLGTAPSFSTALK